jgi:cytochrome c peroxidase
MSSWECARAEFLILIVCGLYSCTTPPEAPVEPPTLNPDLVQRGAFVFVDPRISADGSRSCETCHPGGGSDGLVYRDGAEVAPGTPGARNSTPLRGLWQTAPYMWDGSLPDVRSTLERMLSVEMGGGKPAPYDLDALEAYVLAFLPFDRGHLEADGTPVEPVTLAARRGAAVFLKAECHTCHPAPVYTVPLRYDLGTGREIDTPTLLGLSSTPPYGHDGRWATIEDSVGAMLAARDTELSARERHQLVEYLKLF